MITRLSTGFVVLLGLTALVNAGVPAARHTGHPDSRRNNFMRVARDDYYVALARVSHVSHQTCQTHYTMYAE
ncbi:hypothetical protein BDR05DRAFT_1058674 [Suillus weaverae]|nr:hypothetical protein BDR05DRAFT_1058674 [Suillus weaverae]